MGFDEQVVGKNQRGKDFAFARGSCGDADQAGGLEDGLAELAAGHCSELASRGVGGANEGSFYRAFVVAPVSVALRCVRVIRQTSPDEPRTEERSTTPNPTSPASATSSGSPNASSFQLCTVSLRTSSASARREQAGFVSASLAGLATTRVAVRRLPSI